ncbi:MAG: hypothetical protein LBF97_08195 [Elusimicrobiota bacterium]|jgi:hypothetical protein|nr:hypothetical protein [Elusimicrobiota bacterium]
MNNTAMNLNNFAEIRKIGLEALKKALGTVGMIRFIQQYENGIGDYTKEKYKQKDFKLDEIDIMLRNTKKRDKK